MDANERWLRRGHVRKPNAIVRSIYRIADWFGDFQYLMNRTKRGIANFLLVLVNTIMLLCVIITSAAHSIQLLRYAGATGGLEYFLLVAWELLFITSSILLDRAFKLGKYVEWQLWLPFIMGLAFIEASNIIGMASNWAGIVLGSSTFLLLLCLKWMLIWQMKNPAEEPVSNGVQEVGETVEESSKEVGEITGKPDQNSEKNPAQNVGEAIGISDGKTVRKPEKNPVLEAGENQKLATENPSQNAGEKAEKIEDKEKTSSKPETKKVKASAAKKRVKKKKEVNRDLEAILEVAKALKMANRLTRSTLEKEAGTTTHYARKAMAMLEKIEAENPVGEPTKNPEENPAQELEKNQEKPKLQLVK